MTQKELEHLCALWQKRLRLQDWRVELGLVRHYELPDRYGKTEWRRRHRQAKVQLLDPQDYEPEWADAGKLEVSLVHELCHLYCPDTSDESDEDVEFETMLNMVAEALVTAYRHGEA